MTDEERLKASLAVLTSGRYFRASVPQVPCGGHRLPPSVYKVENTGEVQKVKMEDDATKVRISKSDITTGDEIPGAKLTIFDKDGKEVESWVSEEKPHYIEKLPAGEYTLREEMAPDGYLRAEDAKFNVNETGEIQTVIMKDEFCDSSLLITFIEFALDHLEIEEI